MLQVLQFCLRRTKEILLLYKTNYDFNDEHFQQRSTWSVECQKRNNRPNAVGEKWMNFFQLWINNSEAKSVCDHTKL